MSIAPSAFFVIVIAAIMSSVVMKAMVLLANWLCTWVGAGVLIISIQCA